MKKSDGPKKRDTAPKRESILNAAVTAFQEEGYDRTSMDRVAEVAGASKRTVYNHFKSKEELLLAVTERFLVKQQALKNIKYDPSVELEKQLELFVESELFFINDPLRLGLSKVLTSVFLFNNQMAIDLKTKFSSELTSLIDWLKAAEKDKKLKVTNRESAAHMFYSMVQGILTWPPLFTGPMEPQVLETKKKELIHMFLSYYRI